MKVKFLLIPFLVLLRLALINAFSGNGDGGITPYEITNCTQLQEMRDNLGADYVLMNYINCLDTINWNSGDGFIPIGDDVDGFEGTLDGQGYTISDLYINRATNNIGLFGRLVQTNQISNLNLGVEIYGANFVGGLIGYFESGNVINCSVSGIIEGDEYVGGLAGYSEGTITNSYSMGSVIGDHSTGGLIGYNYGIINNSFAMADVNLITSGESESLGGLTGKNFGTIDNSYATGNVNGYDYVGGLSGDNGDSDKDPQGYINNCWASGNVTGGDEVGGLVGDNTGTINNSYSSGFVNSTSNGGGLVGQNEYYILNSYSNSSVFTGNEIFSYAGGLVGTCNNYNSFINNSYAMGDVEGKNGLGGLVGSVEVNCIISNCYSTGYVFGETNLGGLIGESLGTVTNSFWNIETSGQATSDGGIGKTNDEMKNITTFTDSDWDFIYIWVSNVSKNRGYPYLSWQILEDIDSTSPYFTIIPANQEITSGITWNGVKFEGEDETLLHSYFIDDTTNFIINQTGFLNWTGQLDVDNYYINVSVNDSAGNINFTIYNLNITQISTLEIPRSSGGGGGKKLILNTTQTNQTTTYNQTVKSSDLNDSKAKNPSQLFDIKLELDSATINNANELSFVITFASFGNVPTFVDLNYSILDSSGKEVYSEKGNVTVTTEQIVRKNFENLNLLDGKYALILTTVYGDNVKDEFRQEFSVGNSKALQNAKNNWIWYTIVGGIVVALVIVFIIVYKIYKKRKGHSTQ